jgi:hypothetical protein
MDFIEEVIKSRFFIKQELVSIKQRTFIDGFASKGFRQGLETV